MRLTIVVCIVLSAASAHAESKADEAKRHFSRSKELYEDGDFVGALNELERAYTAVPNFKLLFNIAQIQAQTQNYAGALRSYRRFLLEGGSEVPDSRRAEVLKEVDKFRTRVAELTIVCSEGAEVSVDDVVVGKAPLADPVTVNIGRRKISATLPNHFPVTKFVDVAGLDMLNVKLEFQSVVTQSAGDPAKVAQVDKAVEPAKPARPLPAWVPWIGAVALGGATAAMGIVSLNSSKEQTALLNTYGVTRAQLDAAASKTRTQALVTDILGGCTAAAAVGSLLYTLFRPSDDTPPAVSLGLSVNSLFVSGSF